MKRVLLVMMGLLYSAPAVFGEVFIYKNSLRYVYTGGGGIERLSVAGWTIVNDFGDVTQVLAFPRDKRYSIVPLQSIVYTTADAGGGRQITFFIQNDTWPDSSGQTHVDTGGAKGLNSVITVNGVAWSMPKVFTWVGRSLIPSDGNRYYAETSGRFTYDKSATTTSNTAGDNMDAAAQRLAQALEAKGYIPHAIER